MANPAQFNEGGLQDYQMQMMLLEQQNKKRPMMSKLQLQYAPTSAHALAKSMSLPPPTEAGPASPHWQELHQIDGSDSTVFARPPSWNDVKSHGRNTGFLRGASPIADPAAHAHGVAFTVTKHYRYGHGLTPEQIHTADPPTSCSPAAPTPVRETIAIRSDSLARAVDRLLGPVEPLDLAPRLESPFVAWWLCGGGEKAAAEDAEDGELLSLGAWIQRRYGAVHRAAEAQRARGRVCAATMPFLVRPGEVLVGAGAAGQGYVARSWPRWKEEGAVGDGVWSVDAWMWGFAAGRFDQRFCELLVRLPAGCGQAEVDVRELNLVPLLHVGEEVRASLERRGEAAWAFRMGGVCEYQGEPEYGLYPQRKRYVVDIPEYSRLHPHKASARCPVGDHPLIYNGAPPTGLELLVFPQRVGSYNPERCIWDVLPTEGLRAVPWTPFPLDQLVLGQDKRNVLKILATTKLERDDDATRQREGLTMLFHGPPGSGKGFAAAAVAELAKKPLLRLDCRSQSLTVQGLATVLGLGMKWRGVVLLDHADALLRPYGGLPGRVSSPFTFVTTLTRLIREYDGILIMKTSHEQALDDHVASEVKFDLKFEKLAASQRCRVWDRLVKALLAREAKPGDERTALGKRKSRDEAPTPPPAADAARQTGIDSSAFYSELLKHDHHRCLGYQLDKPDNMMSRLCKAEMNTRQMVQVIVNAERVAAAQGTKLTPDHLIKVVRCGQ